MGLPYDALAMRYLQPLGHLPFIGYLFLKQCNEKKAKNQGFPLHKKNLGIPVVFITKIKIH